MNLKSKRMTAVLLILTFVLQIAGCRGQKELSGKPSDVIESLETSINKLDYEELLSLMVIEKGSTRYKEYKETLDLSTYTDDAAKVYQAVASGIELDYNESSVELGSGIAKVRVTFSIPNWKAAFDDSSYIDTAALIDGLAKLDKEKADMTLRLIDTKDGLKIKNIDELMDLFDFMGCEITILSDDPEPTVPETTEPGYSDPDYSTATLPTERIIPSSDSPYGTKPPKATAPKGTDEDVKKALVEYRKVLKQFKTGIEWYQRNFNANSCGLMDFNNDNVPELYFFTRSNTSDNYAIFRVYSYKPTKEVCEEILYESLTDVKSKISEFFVLKTGNGKIVTYKGFIDDTTTICTYSLYEYVGPRYVIGFEGTLFCTITNIDDNDISVYKINNVDKYTENTSVDAGEFHRVERDLLNSTETLFSASFIKDRTSVARECLGGTKLSAQPYAQIIKKLGS